VGGQRDGAAAGERDALGLEQDALHARAQGVVDADRAQPGTALADHALPRQAHLGRAGAHGGADRARCAGHAGELGHLSVGEHVAARDASHQLVDGGVALADQLGDTVVPCSGRHDAATLRQSV
jgi:hypothetical protein